MYIGMLDPEPEKMTRLEQMDLTLAEVQSRKEVVEKGEKLEREEMEVGLWESLRRNKMVVVYMLAAYSCAAVYGYDSIANGASLAMPQFDLYFGHYDETTHQLYLDSIWTSLWSSMSNVGSILGSAIAGPVSQKIGRRYTGVAFGFTTIIGVAVQYVSTSSGQLLVGRMINGLAVGGLLAVGTTYASEISPTRLRGFMLGGLAFFIVMMQTIGLAIVRALVSDPTPRGFRIVFAIQWVVGILPIIAFTLSPESPNYLLIKHRIPEARKALSRLYGRDNNIDIRLAHLEASLHRSTQTTTATYIDCFRGSNLKRTLTVCLLMFGSGLIGVAFLTQNIYFLSLTGLPVLRAFDINIGGFGLALLIMPITWLLGDNFGRRSVYLIGVLGNVVVLAVIGGLGYIPSSNLGAVWAIAILLNLLITWQQFTNTVVVWSLSPSLSTLRLRQHTNSIAVMAAAFTSWLFAFVTPYMYNVGSGSGNLGAKTALVYAGCSVVLLVVAWFWIPETRGLGMSELDELYEGGVKPREFGRVGKRGRAEGEGDGEGIDGNLKLNEKIVGDSEKDSGSGSSSS